MAFLLGAAALMSSASKPVPAMIEKPLVWDAPSAIQLASPRSQAAVLAHLQALASAAGSGELPMFAKSRFAVPEGNTQTSDISVAQRVQKVGDRAVSTRHHDDVKALRIREDLLVVAFLAQDAKDALVARVDELALEREDGVGAKARAWIMCDEAAHGILLSVRVCARMPW